LGNLGNAYFALGDIAYVTKGSSKSKSGLATGFSSQTAARL